MAVSSGRGVDGAGARGSKGERSAVSKTMLFSGEQRAVITASSESDMGVEAGPGSGKSRTVAGRVAWLLIEEGIPPAGVVAITFTDAAAAKLRERVAQILDDKGRSPIMGLSDLTVSTIHAFLLHLLQAHVPKYRKFAVLAAAERDLLLRSPRVAPAVNLGRVARLDMQHLHKGRQGEDPPSPFLSGAFEDRQRFLLAADLVREACSPEVGLPGGFRLAFAEYREILAHRRCWDYSELLSAALAALCDEEDDDCLALQHHVAANLRCVLVDEYNDVNPILVRILSRLRALGTRIVAIGDSDQTCFRFRGSDPTSFDAFARDFPGADWYPLLTNRRSSPGIVGASRAFIENQPILGRRAKPLRVPRVPRQEYELGDLAVLRFGSVAQQDAFGVARLNAMRGTPYRDEPEAKVVGLAWSNMMVVVRQNTSARRIAGALRAAGIPVDLSGAENLLESPEALAIAALYEFMGGTMTEEQARMEVLAGRLGVSASIERGLAHLRDKRAEAESATKPMCMIEIMYEVLGKMRFHQEGLLAVDAGQRDVVLCNVARVFRAAQAYQTVHYRDRPLSKFGDFAVWLREDAPRVYEDDIAMGVSNVAPDAVRVRTVHGAKGDEAAFVWIADVCEGTFPDWRADRPDIQHPAWAAIPRTTVDDPDRYDSTPEDEIRLMFVALSRAQKFLLVTYGRPDRRYTNLGKPMPFPKPSRYLPALARDQHFVTSKDMLPPAARQPKIEPSIHDERRTITLSFSDLFLFFICAHQFRLRVLYGFPPAANEAIGFAESLHRCFARFHELGGTDEPLSHSDLMTILDETFHTPNAGPQGRERLKNDAGLAFADYAAECISEGATGVSVEKEVEVRVGSRLRCVGRFDLALLDAVGRRVLRDWKTSSKAADRDPERLVARLYALGYEDRTGEQVDAFATHIVRGRQRDTDKAMTEQPFDEASRADVWKHLIDAERSLTAGDLPMLGEYDKSKCGNCDTRHICLRMQDHEDAKLMREGDG